MDSTFCAHCAKQGEASEARLLLNACHVGELLAVAVEVGIEDIGCGTHWLIGSAFEVDVGSDDEVLARERQTVGVDSLCQAAHVGHSAYAIGVGSGACALKELWHGLQGNHLGAAIESGCEGVGHNVGFWECDLQTAGFDGKCAVVARNSPSESVGRCQRGVA